MTAFAAYCETKGWRNAADAMTPEERSERSRRGWLKREHGNGGAEGADVTAPPRRERDLDRMGGDRDADLARFRSRISSGLGKPQPTRSTEIRRGDAVHGPDGPELIVQVERAMDGRPLLVSVKPDGKPGQFGGAVARDRDIPLYGGRKSTFDLYCEVKGWRHLDLTPDQLAERSKRGWETRRRGGISISDASGAHRPRLFDPGPKIRQEAGGAELRGRAFHGVPELRSYADGQRTVIAERRPPIIGRINVRNDDHPAWTPDSYRAEQTRRAAQEIADREADDTANREWERVSQRITYSPQERSRLDAAVASGEYRWDDTDGSLIDASDTGSEYQTRIKAGTVGQAEQGRRWYLQHGRGGRTTPDYVWAESLDDAISYHENPQGGDLYTARTASGSAQILRYATVPDMSDDELQAEYARVNVQAVSDDRRQRELASGIGARQWPNSQAQSRRNRIGAEIARRDNDRKTSERAARWQHLDDTGLASERDAVHEQAVSAVARWRDVVARSKAEKRDDPEMEPARAAAAAVFGRWNDASIEMDRRAGIPPLSSDERQMLVEGMLKRARRRKDRDVIETFVMSASMQHNDRGLRELSAALAPRAKAGKALTDSPEFDEMLAEYHRLTGRA